MKNTSCAKAVFLSPLIALALIVLFVVSPGCFHAAEKPNIILISIDTLRPDHLGCYGYGRKTSPHIDTLAKEGALFFSAFSHSPHTTPSHMSIMTSLHQDVHRVIQGGIDNPDNPGTCLDPAIPTLAEILKSAGYTTAGFTGGGHVNARHGFNKGFDIYKKGSIGDALAWLEVNRSQKLFLFFHTYAVHDPYLPPPGYNRMYDKAYAGNIIDSREEICARIGGECGDSNWWRSPDIFWASVDKNDPRDVAFLIAQYDAAINFVDNEMISPLLNKLKELNIYENTLIIFTADHGEAFKEHNNFRHDDLHAEVLQVPLIIVYPRVISKNKSVKQLVRLTDIMPTVLEIAGIRTKTLMQGKSLVPAMTENNALELSCYSAVYDIKAIRTDNYAFIENPQNKDPKIRRLLYNRKDDPPERHDIAVSCLDVVGKLEQQLREEVADSRKLSAGYSSNEAGPLAPEDREKLRSLGYM